MLHGQTPYASNTLTELSAKPANVPGGGLVCDWNVQCSPELEYFVMKLLAPLARDRFSATEALNYIDSQLVPKVADNSYPKPPELRGFPPRLNSAPRNSVRGAP